MTSLAQLQNLAIFGESYSGQDAYLNFDEFLPLLGGYRYRSALDIGCGNGAIACRLTKGCAADVVGIDVSRPLIDIARQNAFLSETDNRASFHVLDMDALTPEILSAHDLIYSLDSLQHSRNLAVLLNRISCSKKPSTAVAGSIWCVGDDALAARWGFPEARAPSDVQALLTWVFSDSIVGKNSLFSKRLAAHLRFQVTHQSELTLALGEYTYRERVALLEDSLNAAKRGVFQQVLFSTVAERTEALDRSRYRKLH